MIQYCDFCSLVNASQAHPGSPWTETFSSCGSQKTWFVLYKELYKEQRRVVITQVVAELLTTQKPGSFYQECNTSSSKGMLTLVEFFVRFFVLFLRRAVQVTGQANCSGSDGRTHLSEVCSSWEVAHNWGQTPAGFCREGSCQTQVCSLQLLKRETTISEVFAWHPNKLCVWLYRHFTLLWAKPL